MATADRVKVGSMQEEHEKAIAGLRKEFVEACRVVFGESLVAIINKGSTVKGGFIPGLSDVDLHVYLKDDVFVYNDFLRLELGLSLQNKMDKLICRYDFGGGPVQVIMMNVSKPRDWSGPLPGTYVLLYGDECPEPPPTSGKMLEHDRAGLLNPHYGYGLVNSLVDKGNGALPNYVQRLNTAVTPTLYRVLSLLTREPFRTWSMARSEVLQGLEQMDVKGVENLAELGRRFYRIASKKSQLHTDPELCKEAMRIGFGILDFGREAGKEL